MDDRLASFVTASPADPASKWPGAPPNFGQPVVEHVFTVSGQTGLAGRAYLNADEAMIHDPMNSERMKADCGITESLEARQRASALLNWHIEPEEENSPDAKELAKQMTTILKRTHKFMGMRYSALEAIWAGRSGIANQFASKEVGNCRRIVCNRWEPRHGDKLVFRYDDGSGKYDPDQVGIKVGSASLVGRGRSRSQVEYTSQGMVYWFNDYERKTFIVHKHIIEDGPFDQPRLAGRIHGVGIRSRIYWTWYQMVECMQRALEYLDRAACGVELWRFPANNPIAKAKTEKAAKENVGGGRSIVLVPVFPGDQADLYGVEHLEPGLNGVDRLLQVIKDFFQMKIKRYIMGQTLTSEAEATGMGSGVADAHLATFADIVSFDSRNLEESMTEDFLRHLQIWNFPSSRRTYLRFVIDTESDNIKDKLNALKQTWDMGMPIRTSDLADAVGISVPQSNEDQVFNPQIYGGIQQMRGPQNQGVIQPGGINQHAQQMAQSLMSQIQSSNQPVADMQPEVLHHG
jgi:hypothetical protein